MVGNMTGVRSGRDRRKPERVCVAQGGEGGGVQGSLLYRERGRRKEVEGCGQYALVIFANH